VLPCSSQQKHLSAKCIFEFRSLPKEKCLFTKGSFKSTFRCFIESPLLKKNLLLLVVDKSFSSPSIIDEQILPRYLRCTSYSIANVIDQTSLTACWIEQLLVRVLRNSSSQYNRDVDCCSLLSLCLCKMQVLNGHVVDLELVKLLSHLPLEGPWPSLAAKFDCAHTANQEFPLNV